MWIFGTDQIWSRNGTVINYVEVVMKITDNGAAVKKEYIVYLTTHLLPGHDSLPLHLFWSSDCIIKFIMINE